MLWAEHRRGHDLGYPTANMQLDPASGLKHGIYAVRVGLDGRILDGVANYGRRPTFGEGAPLLEVHVFDYSGDLYGRALDVAFIGWIRAEMRYALGVPLPQGLVKGAIPAGGLAAQSEPQHHGKK